MDDFAFFDRHLSEADYGGAFAAKPDSPCLSRANNIGPEGPAIFFCKRRFRLVETASRTPIPERTNFVVLWVRLKDNDDDGSELVLVTTHLKAKEANSDIRALEGKALLEVRYTDATHYPILCQVNTSYDRCWKSCWRRRRT